MLTYKTGDLLTSTAEALVNTIQSDHELECLSTICFLVEVNESISAEQIITGFNQWSQDKAMRFSENEILQGIEKLYKDGFSEKTLLGFSISPQI